MRIWWAITLPWIVPAVLAAQPQATRPGLEQTLDRLAAVRSFGEVSMSPDGARVAWVQSGASGSTIDVLDLTPANASPRRLTLSPGKVTERGLEWSPDGAQLAFLSDRARPGQLDLYLANPRTGAARRMTRLTGFLADPEWSPDGASIAILFTENAVRAAGPLTAGAVQVGEIGDVVREQRLALVDVMSGRVRQITPADLYVYEYDWAPDGRRLTATAAHGDGDNNWYIAELYTVEAATGATTSILKPGMQIGMPRWSPDGSRIAYIGGLMSDEPSIGGDVYVVAAAGGTPRNLTADLKATPSWLAWRPGGDRILIGEHIDGEAGFATVDVTSGRITPDWRGAEMVEAKGWSVRASLSARHETSAVIRHSYAKPPEVHVGPIGQWRQVTRVNQAISPPWGPARSVHWSNDGFDEQGWLLYPAGYDSTKRYPMIVNPYGGPGAQHQAGWPAPRYAPLATVGYFLFLPNPRGSFGQGQSFTRANVKDFGYGDLRDILAGMDAVLKIVPVDPDRIGITGWSYGGYMTMWAITQSGRFKAAVAGAGLANWQSYYGENGIDQWMIPFFGSSVYDDPAVYAKSSPINFIKNVKAPTLIVVGERDIECPVPQSQEYWHALKTLGVPTKLVIYPGEGHAIAKPEHRLDILKRTVAWFDHYLKPRTAAAMP